MKKLTEKKIIEIARKKINLTAKKVIKGIGDDAAVLQPVSDFELFTADILIEGTHFLFDKITPEDLGWKSLAVNVSDIAAMGGEPDYAVVSLGLNEKVDQNWVEKFYDGLTECANSAGLTIVGGDTVSAKNSIVISIALTGHSHRPVYRNTVKEGDLLLSTGELGASGIGLWLILQGFEKNGRDEIYCQKKHTRPPQRVKEGLFLNQSVADLSMLDSSDGLFNSCQLFCEQSGLGVDIYEDNLQFSPPVARVWQKYPKKQSLLDFALYGGEDYELIIAMSEKNYEKIEALFDQKFGYKLAVIGRFNARKGEIKLISGKSEKLLTDKSFQHF